MWRRNLLYYTEPRSVACDDETSSCHAVLGEAPRFYRQGDENSKPLSESAARPAHDTPKNSWSGEERVAAPSCRESTTTPTEEGSRASPDSWCPSNARFISTTGEEEATPSQSEKTKDMIRDNGPRVLASWRQITFHEIRSSNNNVFCDGKEGSFAPTYKGYDKNNFKILELSRARLA